MTNEQLLAQESNRDMVQVFGSKEINDDYKRLIRLSGAEGIVMLKNDGILPLDGKTVSVYGRVQYDYFYVGNGSGGDVIPPYKVNLLEGIRMSSKIILNEELASVYEKWCKENAPPENVVWGKWPTFYEEMPLTEELVKSHHADAAIVIIGRCAGEDRDSLLQKGSFYLTDDETKMLDMVTDSFSKVVLLINSGNIIDFSWYEKYEGKISALLYVWQGGMESGNSICDVLTGAVNPSAKLTSTIAKKYEDYPSSADFAGKEFNNYTEDMYVGYRYFETFAKEKVLFPFGYGLSYTDFQVSADELVKYENGVITLGFTVKNIGQKAGSEVVQVYYKAPSGKLGKPARALAAFDKTDIIEPGDEQKLTVSFPKYRLASYDDSGKTGNISCYVLEAGDYEFYSRGCVRSSALVGKINIGELEVVERLSEMAAPVHEFSRLVEKDGKPSHETVPLRTTSLKDLIEKNLPKEIPQTGDKGYKLKDVKLGKIDMDTFIAQLDMDELEGLTRGDYVMNSKLGPEGNAGAFGGVTESLRQKGVPPIITTDGPSGIRLKCYCALLPCGTQLASTWNVKLLEELATHYGAEFNEKGSHVMLAPGMNIMRNPLCGRNFEYFSEDPVLNGKIAASVVTGIEKHGKSSCPKHYVCNNQEAYRVTNDSRLSERALREIYLKGFEICITEAKPKNIMTSYNKINGVWGHYHYELCTSVLRGEWGYEGNIVTDWWMRPSPDPDFPALTNDAYRVRAQVDVLMPGGKAFLADCGDGSLLESYNKEGGITLGEIQRTARNVLNFALELI